MADLVVDTGVLIDHLRGHRRFKWAGDRVFYSVITRAELFAGRAVDEQAVETLLEAFIEVPVDRLISEAAGRIRRLTGVSLPDSVVAATALTRRASLVTRNRRDFERVRGLRMRSPP